MFLAVTDWLWPILLGTSLGLLLAYLRNRKQSGQIIYLEPEEFRKNMRRGQLIDIRPDTEFQKERINGSKNYPKKTVFLHLFLIRADQPIFLYGETDKGLVPRVGKKLKRKGYNPVYVLKGGIKGWPFPKK